MSKWRPSSPALYVIPDIHGTYNSLRLILSRIMPLRKNDKLIFLGDYVDRGVDSHKVLDLLVHLEKKYKDQIVFLVGNHELMFMEAAGLMTPAFCNRLSSRGIDVSFFDEYRFWLENGGNMTTIGYQRRAEVLENKIVYDRTRLKDIIPEEHKKFLQSKLKLCYKYGGYIFVHGDYNVEKSIDEQELYDVVWGHSALHDAANYTLYDKEPPWDYTIVTGHNYSKGGGKPLILNKFMMLDCGAFHNYLLVAELNSMEAFGAYRDKKRLVQVKMKKAVLRKPSFKRVENE